MGIKKVEDCYKTVTKTTVPDAGSSLDMTQDAYGRLRIIYSGAMSCRLSLHVNRDSKMIYMAETRADVKTSYSLRQLIFISQARTIGLSSVFTASLAEWKRKKARCDQQSHPDEISECDSRLNACDHHCHAHVLLPALFAAPDALRRRDDVYAAAAVN